MDNLVFSIELDEDNNLDDDNFRDEQVEVTHTLQ